MRFWFSKSRGIREEILQESSKINLESEPIVDEYVPEEVRISEPVTTFLRLFKENPKRFKILAVQGPTIRSAITYVLKDTVNLREFTIKSFGPCMWSDVYYKATASTDWMTEFEIQAVTKAISSYYSCRRDRLQEINKKRKREVLLRLYKDE